MKISFDFDGCLTLEYVQKIATSFIEKGFDVWVTTSRCDTEYALTNKMSWVNNQNLKLFELTDKLNISRDNIQFCNMQEKWKFLKDFDAHYDDDELTIELINENLPTCLTILI